MQKGSVWVCGKDAGASALCSDSQEKHKSSTGSVSLRNSSPYFSFRSLQARSMQGAHVQRQQQRPRRDCSSKANLRFA